MPESGGGQVEKMEVPKDQSEVGSPAPFPAARRRGTQLGRPLKMMPERLQKARALLESGAHSKRSVAALLGVHESTIRRTIKE